MDITISFVGDDGNDDGIGGVVICICIRTALWLL